MKIIYFVQNGRVSSDDILNRERLRSNGNKVFFSNGSVPYGFEDSCDAVYLAGNFPNVEAWANSKGIKVIKPEPIVNEPEKQHATDVPNTEEKEETEEEVKPVRRTRRRKTDSE